MKNYYLNRICLALILMCSLSCTSDLDFNQASDLKLTPVIVGNFSHFDIPAPAFIADDGSEYDLAFDDEEFDVFRDKYLNSYLQRADFYFEINNTINRAFSLTVVLSDANNNPLSTIKFDIPAYSGSTNTVTRTEIFKNARLDLLKRATKIGFLIAKAPGPALNQNSPGSLVLRSSATVYLAIQ
ncbi:MAG: hypothetical protein RLZZ540_1326 [Bacteroidota bacterium]|jgi:hypothetical protein